MVKNHNSGVVSTITTREVDEQSGMKLIIEKIKKEQIFGTFSQENIVSSKQDETIPTLTSTGAFSRHKIISDDENSINIKCNTKKGFKEAKEGDGVYVEHIKGKRGTVQNGLNQTIKTQPDIGVVVKDHGNYISLKDEKGRFNTQDHRAWKDEKIIGTIATNDRFTPQILENNSMGVRIHNDKFTSPTIDTGDGKRIFETNSLKIRKITPREALRLMGVDDKRIDLIQNSNLISHNKQYFIAGNSIVVQVLEAIFNQIWFTKERPLKIFETFAGYGSQAIALENLGYELKTHTSEWFVDAIISYALIHHNKEFYKLQQENKDLTKEELLEKLSKWTLSTDSKKPNDLKRVSQEKLLALLCANITNNNKGSIIDIKGKQLDEYDLLTYSFPCQDLSLAGKRAGMSKDSKTRSGLLWEIERIILELKELNKLPKVLLMENVPQIHSKENMSDFNKWIDQLNKLGYKSTWKDLNAKNFGIPQNRNRTFMVSILDGEVESEAIQQLTLF